MKLRKTLALVAAVAMAFVAMVVPASAVTVGSGTPYEVVIALEDLPAGRTFADVYGVALYLSDASAEVAQAGFGGGHSYFWDGYDTVDGETWDSVTLKWCAYDCLTVGENPDHEALLYDEDENAIIRFEADPIFPDTIEALTVKVEMWWGGNYEVEEMVILGADGKNSQQLKPPNRIPNRNLNRNPNRLLMKTKTKKKFLVTQTAKAKAKAKKNPANLLLHPAHLPATLTATPTQVLH
jgi:hypothetical protein